MIAKEKALIRSINDKRVFCQSLCVQRVKQTTNVVINRSDNAKVIFDITLVFPMFFF